MTITGEISRLVPHAVLLCPAACLVHVGSHNGGCHVSMYAIDIVLHGGKCMVVIVCSYAQPPTPCQELLLL